MWLAGIRSEAKAWLRRRFLRSPRDLTATLGNAPILVIAPHPDDETLGCGGAILMRALVKADVDIAFVTDGAAADSDGMDARPLSEIRKGEARTAAARLHVREDRLHFLDHPDGSVAERRAEIVADLVAILRTRTPAAVFIPHRAEDPPDHHMTRAFALQALKEWGSRVMVFEYGIWCWVHWPWVKLKLGLRGWPGAISRRSVLSGFGFGSLSEFNYRIDLKELAESKRHAFAAYASQRQSLGQIADGDFIERLLERFEAYHVYWANGSGRIR
jgi:LmbE family N-acetylglucosaminyl deacetylase